MKKIYVIKDQQQHGPFSRAEVVSRVINGEFSGADLAWCGDPTKMMPISQLVNGADTGPAIALEKSYSTAELVQIATKQKAIIWSMLFMMLFMFVPVRTERLPFYIGMAAVLHVICAVLCGQIARIMGKRVWLWVLFSLFTIINFVALARILSETYRVLKMHGISTGRLGVPARVIDRIGNSESAPTGADDSGLPPKLHPDVPPTASAWQ